MASFNRGFTRGAAIGAQSGIAALNQSRRIKAVEQQAQEARAIEQRKQGLDLLIKGREIAAAGDVEGGRLLITQFAFPKLALDPNADDPGGKFAKAYLSSLGKVTEGRSLIDDLTRGVDPRQGPIGKQIEQFQVGDATRLIKAIDPATPPVRGTAVGTGPVTPGTVAQPAMRARARLPGIQAPSAAPGAVGAPQPQTRLPLQERIDRLRGVPVTQATQGPREKAITSLQAEQRIALDRQRLALSQRAEARGELRSVPGQGLIRVRPGQTPELLVPSLNTRQVLQSDIRRLQALGDKATPGQKRELEANLRKERSMGHIVGRTAADLKVEAEARQAAEGSVDSLGQMGVILRDVEATPFAVGFRGSFASTVSGFLKQIPGMSLTAEGVSQLVAEGSVKEVQKIRTDLLSQIGPLFKTVLNDTSGRYSDRDVELIQKAQGALNASANEQTVRGAIQALATAELRSRNRNLVQGGLGPDFDLSVPTEQRRLARVLGTMGFTQEEAVKIRNDLLIVQELGRQLSGKR